MAAASSRVRKLHLVLLCAVVVGAGTVLRLLDLAGVGPLPDLPGIAAVIVPLLGLIELRRILRTLFAVGRRRQRRLVYRFEGDAPAECYSDDGVPGRLIDASAAGVGLVLEAPLEIGAKPAACSSSKTPPEAHEVAAQVEVRSCRERRDATWSARRSPRSTRPRACRLMEWCYVVCSHERLRRPPPGDADPGREGGNSPAPADARTGGSHRLAQRAGFVNSSKRW